ncbi:hypothetical protein HBI47_171510 [Parastagonospora nodorum]|nr:hypothetical protein HBI47_171510 [Parastagonospora nodorum]
MAEESYKDYLAARLLTENKPVTYRLLSRALQVNVNSAKLMLFDFHQKQNAKKAKSVHATYLITGKQRAHEASNGTSAQDSADVDMRSSPFKSSMPEAAEDEGDDDNDDDEDDEEDDDDDEPVQETTILLVREEELQHTRAEFDEVTSIHVYSLEPGPIEDSGVLAACNHEIVTQDSDEDPMNWWRIYGSIQNPYVKRRTVKSVPPPLAPATTKAAAKPVAKPSFGTATAAQGKAKDTDSTTSKGTAAEDNAASRSTPQSIASNPTLKRSDSKSGNKKSQSAGDLFKSFAKAKPKTKDAEKSKESTPAADEPMQGMSEDEGDAGDMPEVVVDGAKNEAARKAREDRQEKLRKMMEDDDEDMPDAPIETESQPAATPASNAETPESTQGEATVIVENGRRRGKRRVMKKKKVKDEDGYLVTKDEAVWESFSEDEPEPKKLKTATTKPSSSTKGKPAGKKGQGSIASFFKKA